MSDTSNPAVIQALAALQVFTQDTMTVTLTYAALVALRDAGTITRLDFARAARQHHRAEYDTDRAAQKAADDAERAAYQAQVQARIQHDHSTEQLTEDATGVNGAVKARFAEQLLRLDTVAQRRDAQAQAHRFMNLSPSAGRPSDALRTVINEMVR